MEAKTKKIFKKIDKNFKKKRPVTIYMLLSLVLISVFLSSIAFYWFGHNEGYNQKTSEINAQEKAQQQQDLIAQQQQDLMGLELEQVWQIFLKYLMVKTMFWLPWIIGGIILGWILHGIF